MRLLVVGGEGFLGSQVTGVLGSRPGFSVLVAGRRGEVRLDLTLPATFSAMAGFDFVVDCADSVHAAPDEAIAWCRARDIPFIETTAHPPTIRRLLAASAEQEKGFSLLGMGLFPGLSNLVAAAAEELATPCRKLALGIRLSPFSGAGRGMCAVLAEALSESPHGPAAALPFPGGPCRCFRLPLAEEVMLARGTGAAATACVATSPSLPLAALARGLSGGPLPRRLGRGLSAGFCLLLRTGLLRRRPGPVEIVAVAEPASGTDPARVAVRVEDGAQAAACAAAAAVEILGAQGALPTGTFVPDQLFTLEEVVTAMRAAAGERLRIEVVVGMPRGPFKVQETVSAD